VPLRFRFVRCLADVVGPAVRFLSQPGDPFQRQRIIVPHAGAKAWLAATLAERLGAGPAGGDGILANVEIEFPGSIPTLVQPPRTGPDPWSIDRLTFTVLESLAAGAAAELSTQPLLEARRIAGRFDAYHVRRPTMIREWDRDPPNPVLSPTEGDEVHDGVPVPDKLPADDRRQFELWCDVRGRIGTPPPPARLSAVHQTGRGPLLVAGLESLSLYQVECLAVLAEVCEVEVLLVHPSFGLERRWSTSLPAPTPGRARRREELELAADVDPLVATWLAGARNLQVLLASQGLGVDAGSGPSDAVPDTLLERMQATVAAGGRANAAAHDPARDRSLSIHRCHTLSRQAEVIHEAILHCFRDLPGLAPHEVAIVSPCIEQAAPHLLAAFQREVHVGGPAGAPLRLPLIVADRAIREVSPAAELLALLVALPESRCGVDDILAVAGHPLVLAHHAADAETATAWADLVERAEVRWGLDVAHRSRRGLRDVSAVHTWKLGLERLLLAATLPDDAARPELGGVVPVADVETADIPAIATLVRILAVIQRLERLTAGPLPVAGWCDAIEEALTDLCGRESGDLVEPLACLRRLRAAAAGTPAEQRPVPFGDVRHLLVGWLDERAGRQPLRTGAITASSLVSLRGIPFRVICVIGYDDGAVGVAEAEGDDLVSRQQLVGDLDPRIDERRALLDCLLAASDRLVIACTGQNIKTNEAVPLVTPLAELVDFAVRHGVAQSDAGRPSGIEICHPRHHLGGRNFLPGAVQPGVIWSHDPTALAVSGVLGAPVVPPAASRAPVEPPRRVIELQLLTRLAQDPLRLHLEETLGIDTWRGDEVAIPATLPLTLPSADVRRAVRDLVAVLVADAAGEEAWLEALRRSGRLPIGPHGAAQLREIRELAHGFVAVAAAKGVPLTGFVSNEVRIDLGDTRLTGHIDDLQQQARQLVVLTTGAVERDSFGRPLHAAAVRLLAARAAGLDVAAVSILSRNKVWSPGAATATGRPVNPCQLRTVVLDERVDPARRLADLVPLLHEALAAPHGLFGLGEAAAADRRRKFDEFVKPRSFGRGYALSCEAIVYGSAPAYEQVFPAGSAAVAFLDRYASLLTLAGKAGSTEYRLS